MSGYSPRGMDVDKNGVVWMPQASGHFASFDRRKCEGPLNGQQATGKQCPEGWTLYPFPGPKLVNDAGSGSAEASYYAWVDQFNTLGLGADVPIATGNGAEGLLALVDGKFVTLRVPYPLGFYIKGILVTDFVTPAWYGYKHAHGPIDFKGHSHKAFEVLDGGYAQKFDPNGGWVQVTGKKAMMTGHGAIAAKGSRRERRTRRDKWHPSDVNFGAR